MNEPEHPADPLPESWAAEEQEAGRASGRSRRTVWIAGIAVLVLLAGGVFIWSRSGDGPEERAWPDTVSGRPPGLGDNGQTAADVTPDVEPGVYVWSGFDGWHLWVVPGEGVAGVRGTITSTVDITEAELSAPGEGSVSADGHTVTFDLGGDAAVSGVDFEPGFYAKRLEITLEGDGGPLSPSVVTLGPSTAAKAVPVVIEKAVVDE